MHATRLLIVAATLLSAAAAQTAPPPRAPLERLIVLNKGAASASLIDPATRKEVALVDVGDGPHEVAVAPDGKTAAVCNYGGQKPGNSLTVIDVAAGKPLATFELRAPAAADGTAGSAYLRPHGIQFLPDGRHLVVTSEQARRLLVVDLQEQRVVRALPTTQRTLHMVALAGDGKTAFGASIQDGSLGVFALAAGAATAEPPPARIVPTGEGAEGIAVRPRDGEVWVTNRAADTISIVDAAGAKVQATLPTTSFPIRVAFTPDGACALVSCAQSGDVLVFDAKERKLAHTIALLADKTEQSPMPIGICVQPDGRIAWVACQRGEWLAVVDLQTWTLIDRVPARAGPDGMAFARIAAD